MKPMKAITLLLVFSAMCCLWPAMPVHAQTDNTNQASVLPEGVYIKMTREFYEAMKNEGTNGVRVYSNNPSAEYLKQISISARFMVETNLQIIRQQETIIHLLRSMGDNGKK